jgi:hypothetical protein
MSYEGYEPEVISGMYIQGIANSQNSSLVSFMASEVPGGIIWTLSTSSVIDEKPVKGQLLFFSGLTSYSPNHTIIIATDGLTYSQRYLDGQMIYNSSSPAVTIQGQLTVIVQVAASVNYATVSATFSHFYALSSPYVNIRSLPIDSIVRVVGSNGVVIGVEQAGASGAVQMNVLPFPFGNTIYIYNQSQQVGRYDVQLAAGALFQAVKEQ